ncbi:MAG: hydroxyisourate hydrolase [Thermomicrobiales bacterium]
MGTLTTHVLDTAQGIPAERVSCALFRMTGNTRAELIRTRTNSDGRLDRPLLEGTEFEAGTYELEFDIGHYFHHQPLDVSDPPFLSIVTIRFAIAETDEAMHVPLLVSPWSYSTYRGS